MCYERGEGGMWRYVRSPDGLPVMHQDAYFTKALDIIREVLNQQANEEAKRGASARRN